MPWRPELSFPIKMRGGETLRTLEDAMLVLGERSVLLPFNERREAAEAALERAAQTHLPDDIRTATELAYDYFRSEGKLARARIVWRIARQR